jgi:UDP:flavonoid glycosyltransferase YjiC (YdhE family)
MIRNTDDKPLMLIFPFDQLAHYLRCLTLANHLSPYFQIRFAASDRYNTFVLNEGYDFFPCRALDAPAIMAKVQKFDFSWINEPDLEEVLTDQLRVIRLLKPVVVLGDTSLTLKMAAEKCGVFYISLMNGYMSKYYSHCRMLPSAHPLFIYLKYLSPKMLSFLTAIGEEAKFRSIHKPFKKLRRRYGLSGQAFYPDELEGDLTLLCDLPELFPQRNLPGHYSWIPPLYYDSDSLLFQGIAGQLDPGKKTIFVSMGSTGDWQLLRFLNDEHFEGYNLVIAGDSHGVITAGHAIKAAFFNMREVLPLTDLVLCHGGNGTTYQAVLFGIPVLCMCSHFEQEWNVHELEQAGLAGRLNGKTTSEIYAMLDEWINKKNTTAQLRFKVEMEKASEQFQGIVKRLKEDIIVNSCIVKPGRN